MRIWPIVLDHQPAYLGDHTLLSAPLGDGTVADYLRDALHAVTTHAVRVVPPKGTSDLLIDDARGLSPPSIDVYSRDGLVELLRTSELSDALLLIDSRKLPPNVNELTALFAQQRAEPRLIHHLIAFESISTRAMERVTFDARDRVRMIQRHYDGATWPRLAAVSATILPVACAAFEPGLTIESLADLRLLMSSRGAPTRDVPMLASVFNLEHEPGLIAANERLIGAPGRLAKTTQQFVLSGTGQRIHPTAKIVGRVVIQRDAVIEEEATIIGPTVIGAGAHVRAGAVIGHSVIGPGSDIPTAATVYHRAWFGRGDAEPVRGAVALYSHDDREQRLSHDRPVNDVIWLAPRLYVKVKRALDALCAAVTLVLLVPLMSALAAVIASCRDGPIFYGDEREGLNGRRFTCWKFRTMSPRAHTAQSDLHLLDQVDGPHFKVARDPRVTGIGAVLRRTNLDELPQLWNVLRGEMSFVGPRPSPFRENQICIPWREARISVRPGITGLWQICRHDRAAGDFHQWIEYDLLYVQHLSLWTDVKIFAATVVTLGGKLTHFRPSTLLGGKVLDATSSHITAA